MNKKYFLMYLAVVSVIILSIVFIPNMGDFVKLMLFVLIATLTSLYTYSTRKKN